MGREPERAGGHGFVIRQCRRANDNVTTRALNLDFSVQFLCSLCLCGYGNASCNNHRETENTEVAQRRTSN